MFIQPVRLRDWRHSWGLLYMFNVLAMGRGGGGGGGEGGGGGGELFRCDSNSHLFMKIGKWTYIPYNLQEY